ncbi:MAG TPA: LysM peptidoglycan-binding domain-containing protein [Verrucomicrobiota bacterium]|nr:LysM peptidoglycan-binding domain-containing protein [Verrucomicrobiota bacterium]
MARASSHRYLASLALCAGLLGCMPVGHDVADEQKESHFLEGKRCINSMDYHGAIEQFTKALTVNPNSASAHYELGILYEQREPDPAAAIYHYQRYLKLRPNAENADLIRQRIISCKQDLARTVQPLPITPGMQQQLEQLLDEVKRLREENEHWRAYFASLPPAATNTAPVQAPRPTPHTAPPTETAPDRQTAASAAAPMRTHTVQPGESPYSIARKYGVHLNAVMAANPGLEPRRLQPGQTINIPAR